MMSFVAFSLTFALFFISPVECGTEIRYLGKIGQNSTATLRQWPQLYEIPFVANTGCRWRGESPFCGGTCEKDESTIGLGAEFHHDVNYGAACLIGTKIYCCRGNLDDPTWSGIWESSTPGLQYDCRYSTRGGWEDAYSRCGRFGCVPRKSIREPGLFTYLNKEEQQTEIGGKNCDQLYFRGMVGNASNGVINWTFNGRPSESWYKRYGY